MQEHFGLSITKACRIVGLSRSSYHYKTVKNNNNESVVVNRMKELIETHKSWGYPLLHDILRREGLVKNHKRTWRIYRENGLSLKIRKRHKRTSGVRLELAEPTKPNEHWAMDFVQDQLWHGSRFRVLTVLDVFTKECLALEVDTSINGERVSRVLDWLLLTKGRPQAITVDNGPEFAGIVLDRWAYQNNVRLDFIQPGKPIQNAFIESFNGRLRHECLNQHYFMLLREARTHIENWRIEYNTFRPHGSLNGLTPEQFSNVWKEKNQPVDTSETLMATVQVKG